jgi:hypothetical protein
MVESVVGAGGNEPRGCRSRIVKKSPHLELQELLLMDMQTAKGESSIPALIRHSKVKDKVH